MWAGAASLWPTGTRTSNTEALPLESSPVRRNLIPNGPILMISSEALTLIPRCCMIVPSLSQLIPHFFPLVEGQSEAGLCPLGRQLFDNRLGEESPVARNALLILARNVDDP